MSPRKITARRLFVLDTNVLIYAVSSASSEAEKKAKALELIEHADFGLSAQVLQEFYVNVTRKISLPLSSDEAVALLEQVVGVARGEARRQVLELLATAYVQSGSRDAARHALEIDSSFAVFREERTSPQEIDPAQNDAFTAAFTLELLRRARAICRERGQLFIGYDDFHLGDDATHLWGIDLQDFPLGVGAKMSRWH